MAPAAVISGEIVAGANELRQKTQEALESKRGKRRRFKMFGKKDDRDTSSAENDALKAEIEMDEHKVGLDELVTRFGTNMQTGLTSAQAAQILEREGMNRLTPPQTTPWWVLLIATQTGFFSLLLWFGSILCFVGYGLQNDDENLYLGVVLALVVSCTGVFSFFQEQKSSNLMDSFKNMMPTQTTVVRDGTSSVLNAMELVRGDILKLKAGDKVPADLRVLECSDDMKVDNASLTGESEPIKREINCTHENPLETANVCFFGTLIPTGTATCMVIGTGDNTLMGRIARLTLTTTNVETPIAKEIEHFVLIVSTVAVTLGIMFFVIGALLGTEWIANLVFMIGIIVANVPEGLLATVTVCLTLTAKRMHSKSVLVKNLEGVETLGSTSCICSDKTGTLTQNIMTVAHLVYDLAIWDVESTMASQNFNEQDVSFKHLMRCSTLCNTAVWDENSKTRNGTAVPFEEHITMGDGSLMKKIQWTPIGDASESAMIKFVQTKRDIMEFREAAPANPKGKIPFNSANKYQVQVAWDSEKQQWMDLLKGAPERVAARCKTILQNGEEIPMTAEHLKQIDNLNVQLARRGMRVLAFAEKCLDTTAYPKDYEFDSENVNFPIGESQDQYDTRAELAAAGSAEAPSKRMMEPLCYLGMMALIDPPRPQVPGAVNKCKTAGIKVIMVTGDHPETAKAISKKVGIIWSDTADDMEHRNSELGLKEGHPDWEDPDMAQAIVVPGWDISVDTPDAVWDDILAHPQVVFARTSPQQKLVIVENCQRRRHVVAVTGDGVNDSPALKKADIGVAMGIAGTDVSKEAADMILLDDNFASIVSGIEEGRLIFDNLKKSIAYTLSSNIPEIAPFLSFILIQIPVPLSTVLILCVDLGTDMVPAISMAWEAPEADIMARNPRDADVDRLVTRKLVSFAYLQIGVIQALSGFYTYLTVLNDYGFSPWILPGMGGVDAFGKMTTLCELNDGVWRNYGGEQCPCFDVTADALSQAMCNGMPADFATSRLSMNTVVSRCQKLGFQYWDEDTRLQFVDNGVIKEGGLGEVKECLYPLRQLIDVHGSSGEGDFELINPASYLDANGGVDTGTIALPTKESHNALRGGPQCSSGIKYNGDELTLDEIEECPFFYEFMPYRSVNSAFFDRRWGTTNPNKEVALGLGDNVNRIIALGFQPIGFWAAWEHAVIGASPASGGHISQVIPNSEDGVDGIVETMYSVSALDQTLSLANVHLWSSNNIANDFWDPLFEGANTVSDPIKLLARVNAQANRCQNLCTSQPGFMDAYRAKIDTLQDDAAVSKILDDMKPSCDQSVFDTFFDSVKLGADDGSVQCYAEEDLVGTAPVVNAASRQIQEEALSNAQCASFIGIIVVQWADLVICKTRWLSIRGQGMNNSVMNFALILEMLLGAFLCYVLPVNPAFGTRPLRFTHWFTAMPFSIYIFTYDELRKYFMRQTSDIEVDKLTGRNTRHPGWLERNTYY